MRQSLVAIYQDFHDMLVNLLAQGVAAGEFCAMDTSQVAFTLTALYEGITLMWVMAPHMVDWRRQMQAAQALILAGLQPALDAAN